MLLGLSESALPPPTVPVSHRPCTLGEGGGGSIKASGVPCSTTVSSAVGEKEGGSIKVGVLCGTPVRTGWGFQAKTVCVGGLRPLKRIFGQ